MLAARKELEAEVGETFTVPFRWALAYSFFIFVPVTAWYFYAHTGWSTAYMRPESTISPWAGPFIVSCYFLGMVFGALMAQALLQLEKVRWVYLTIFMSVCWLVGVWALTLNEYLHVGTFDQFHSGQSQLLFENQNFQNELNVMGALLIVPAIGLFIYFRKRSKRFE